LELVEYPTWIKRDNSRCRKAAFDVLGGEGLLSGSKQKLKEGWLVNVMDTNCYHCLDEVAICLLED
jgi:hypothetical protein